MVNAIQAEQIEQTEETDGAEEITEAEEVEEAEEVAVGGREPAKEAAPEVPVAVEWSEPGPEPVQVRAVAAAKPAAINSPPAPEKATVQIIEEDTSVIEEATSESSTPLTGEITESPAAAAMPETDETPLFSREELAEEIPGLAAPREEAGPPEVPAEVQVEEVEIEQEAEVLFSLPEEAADLTEMLQALEPEQAEVVQPIISKISSIAVEIQALPPEDKESGTEKQVLEQALEQWCGRLFEQLGIESDEQTIRHFVSLLIESQSADGTKEETFSPLLMPDKGTHEYKLDESLKALSRLAQDLRQKLHLPLWLGRYTLRATAA